jgi:hypothetical protein
MKKISGVVALGGALILTLSAAPYLHAAPLVLAQDDDHRDARHDDAHPEYANNRFYQMGNREGYQDHEKKTERKEHHHKYRNDEDRKAHDYGYQQGLQGQRYDHDDHNPH